MPFITTAASGGGSGSFSVLILAVPLALLGFLILAQRRRAKQELVAQAGLAVGDAVMTRAGMFGVVSALDGPTVLVRVAPGVELRFDRRAVIPGSAPVAQTDDDAGSPDAEQG